MTCHSIMGLLDPKSFEVTGSLTFENRNLFSLSRKEKHKLYGGSIAMIPQNPMTAFDPSARIGKQMKETLRLHSGLSSSKLVVKVKEALEKAGLDEPDRVYRSHPHALSGGMLQRVMIAMAQMVDAALIVRRRTHHCIGRRQPQFDSGIIHRASGAGGGYYARHTRFFRGGTAWRDASYHEGQRNC